MSKCEKCGEDLADKNKSNANWAVFNMDCPVCGHHQSITSILASSGGECGKAARKKADGETNVGKIK